MSTLKVNTIQPESGSTINVASGNVFSAPGLTLQTLSIESGSGQKLVTTSQTRADIPTMTMTITPKLATSKIFLMYTLHIYVNNHSTLGNWQAALTSLTRSIGGGTYSTLQDETTGMYTVGQTQTDNSHRFMGYYTWQYFDTPNTTSAIIYQVQGRSKISDGNVQFNRQSYGPPGKFTAMEIAQ